MPARRPHCATCTCGTQPPVPRDHVMPPADRMRCPICRGTTRVLSPSGLSDCDRCDNGYVPRPPDASILGPQPKATPMPEHLRAIAARHRNEPIPERKTEKDD